MVAALAFSQATTKLRPVAVGGEGSAFGLPGREGLRIVSGEWIAANSPVAALDLFEDNPCHGTHVFAFD